MKHFMHVIASQGRNQFFVPSGDITSNKRQQFCDFIWFVTEYFVADVLYYFLSSFK